MSWLRVAAVLGAGVLTRTSLAQDFFDNSPGPLSAGHEELDSSDDCQKCHKLGGGVTNFLCMNCHQHEPLRDAIERGEGLHATFKGRACTECHTEHKGRRANINNWRKVGGRRKFNHDKTGFRLVAGHKKAACSSCHRRKLRSGRVSYIGLTKSCNGCHKNPHRFSSKDLLGMCTECHTKDGGQTKALMASSLPIDHAQRSGVSLKGSHSEAKCLDCHKKARMNKRDGRSCNSCHKSPHGRSFKRAQCQDCHQVAAEWKTPSFSHEKTKLPLRGRHRTKRCAKCHKTKRSIKQPPRATCQPCHKDPHKKRFKKSKIGCKSCHGLGGVGEPHRFKHGAKTEFALTGKHSEAECRQCHRGNRPYRFERLESSSCMGCHAHKKAHEGQYQDDQCLKCHREAGSTQLSFDHQKDTRFALTGLHLQIKDDCRKCHESGNFRSDKLECKDCHEDSHQGSLGKSCERCHTTSVRFKELAKSFDHSRISAFKLEGLHVGVDCAKCHEDRDYKSGKSRCVQCHQDDDPHNASLGFDCEGCHTPEKGAPLFEHNSKTAFKLTHAHLKVECGHCHQPARKTPPKVGWTKASPKPPMDRGFPVMGETCADCHFDQHEGAYGKKCASCHNTVRFSQVQAAVHDTGAFRLLGTHDRLDCQRCHQQDEPLTGLGARCVSCHRQEDVHNNALGENCGDCHGQFAWSPPRFNHGRVGFALSGAHRTADCRDCHGVGQYVGVPRNCDRCHQPAADRVPDPPHNAPQMVDCQLCHTEVSFTPARPTHPWYPLSGAHRTARCTDCHTNGAYAGTPSDCVGCHLANFESPNNRPNHVAAGFPTRCDACHTPTVWAGARYQHQRFIRRGTHRALDCQQCHVGGDYSAAFGAVTQYDCTDCHGVGAPVDRWPADHDQRGFPSTCGFCHNELGWTPAKMPR